MKFYIEQLANIEAYEQLLKLSIVDDEKQTSNSMVIKVSKGNNLVEVGRGDVLLLQHMCEKYLNGN